MSLYVLDTDALSLYQHKHAILTPRVDGVEAGGLAITVIAVEEQLTGWYTLLRKAKGRTRIAEVYQRLADAIPMMAWFRILPFSEAAIIRYEALVKKKLNVGKNDLRIAAITQEHGAILVSRNLKDFQRVPGLQVEDWSV